MKLFSFFILLFLPISAFSMHFCLVKESEMHDKLHEILDNGEAVEGIYPIPQEFELPDYLILYYGNKPDFEEIDVAD